jgi:dTDP-4-dehydrorhamnose 3,5-epimerase
MKFLETTLKDAYLTDLTVFEDSRGFFAESWNKREFAEHGIHAEMAQANLSFNHKKGTLRGMHFQHAPHAETKLVRCIRGGILDIICDIRPESPTYLKWQGFELTAENRRMLIVPEGFAHGYQTLEDNVEVLYLVSEYYTPQSADGIRWDDPALKLEWPMPPTVISPKDEAFAPYQPVTR